MKAVVNDYESSYKIIIPGNCDMLDVNNDGSSNEPSITVYRLTVRKLCKQLRSNEFQNSCQKSYPNHEKKKTSTTLNCVICILSLRNQFCSILL